jgi:hypothetical protein
MPLENPSTADIFINDATPSEKTDGVAVWEIKRRPKGRTRTR